MAPVHEPANSRKDEALPAVEVEKLDDVVYPPHEIRGEGYLQEFQREHDIFSDLLRDEGIEVVMLTDLLDEDQAGIAETLPNMVYTRDVCMVSKLGAHSLRMTYAARQVEPFLVEKAMEKLGELEAGQDKEVETLKAQLEETRQEQISEVEELRKQVEEMMPAFRMAQRMFGERRE